MIENLEDTIKFKYKSIPLLHNYIHNVISWADYNNKELPKLYFNGYVKLHGTNSSIIKNYDNNEFSIQSKRQRITVEKDNNGFAKFISNDLKYYESLLDFISKKININLKNKSIALYGEFAGKNITKKVGISKIEPSWFIFNIGICNNLLEKEDFNKIEYLDSEQTKEIINEFLKVNYKNNVYNLYSFKKYEIEIDFNKIEESKKILDKYTDEVDEKCPVSEYLNSIGPGEGIVWHCKSDIEYFNKTMFKTKGKSHKIVKEIIPKYSIDIVDNINKFVDFCATENRFEQGLDYLKEKHLDLDIKNIPIFLKWVVNDCLDEEKNLLNQLKLEKKQVTSEISKKAKNYYLELLNNNLNEKINKLKI